MSKQVIVIGAGPVGLATAILLAQLDYQIDIYEARAEIPNNPEESYPIGINPRGLYTLEQISPALEQVIKKEGKVINSWQIFAGTRRVAKLDSGVVYGTSRGKVNLILLQYLQTHHADTCNVHFHHKLHSLDPESKILVFTNKNNNEVRVDAGSSRVIAADGVYSKVRRELATKIPDKFQRIVTPWTNEYRVLFAQKGKEFDRLDPAVHYIFGSCYTATIDNDGQQQWTAVMAARDTDSYNDRSLILSTDSSPSSIEGLKSLLAKRAPWLDNVFSYQELGNFFTRKTYRGAIVECSSCCPLDEWVLLIGDAHHSVLPPTGEGINSGLEDALILSKAFQASPLTAFTEYERKRKPDLDALLVYARYLNETPWFGGEIGARVLFMILEGREVKSSISYNLFGPGALDRLAYRDIVGPWQRKKASYLPVARLVVYPFAVIFQIIALPWTLFIYLTRPAAQIAIDHSMKPPV